jgi:hypothetical protein
MVILCWASFSNYVRAVANLRFASTAIRARESKIRTHHDVVKDNAKRGKLASSDKPEK